MITINEIKLATLLADDALTDYYGDDDSMWEQDEDGNDIYSEEAQSRFDYLYNQYLMRIQGCEDTPLSDGYDRRY